jgi:hypothetical protein
MQYKIIKQTTETMLVTYSTYVEADSPTDAEALATAIDEDLEWEEDKSEVLDITTRAIQTEPE